MLTLRLCTLTELQARNIKILSNLSSAIKGVIDDVKKINKERSIYSEINANVVKHTSISSVASQFR